MPGRRRSLLIHRPNKYVFNYCLWNASTDKQVSRVADGRLFQTVCPWSVCTLDSWMHPVYADLSRGWPQMSFPGTHSCRKYIETEEIGLGENRVSSPVFPEPENWVTRICQPSKPGFIVLCNPNFQGWKIERWMCDKVCECCLCNDVYLNCIFPRRQSQSRTDAETALSHHCLLPEDDKHSDWHQ